MVTEFERLRELEPHVADRAREAFVDELDFAEIAFRATSDENVFLTRQEGLTLRVELDAIHGIVRVSADTGVDLPAEGIDLFWGYANFCMVFLYKHCRLVTAPQGEVPGFDHAWRAGERIHYCVDVLHESWGIEELVKMAARTANRICGVLKRLEAGEDDLSVFDPDEDERMWALRRMLERANGADAD